MEKKEDILDITGPIPIPVFPWQTVAIVALCFVALAIVAVIVYMLTRPKPPEIPSTRETTLARLRELRARIGAIEPYALSILVCDALRDYFSQALRIPAKRQTSPEFLASVHARPEIGEERRANIAVFLQRMDAAKFAHELPTDHEMEFLIDDAVAIVDHRPVPTQ
jgi:hypothetical protein